TGAVATSSWGKGATWTKAPGTGRYQLAISRAYQGFSATGGFVGSQLVMPAAALTGQADIDVHCESYDFSTGTFVFQFCKTSDGTAVDPTVVLELLVKLEVIDSSVPKG